MKVNIIKESTFSNDNWSHKGKFDYPVAVIDKILAGEDLRLGDKGSDGFLSADIFNPDKLKELRNRLCNKDYNCKPNELENCLNDGQTEKKIWTRLFKGDFSGYNESDFKNKGNLFEKEYIEEFNKKYKDALVEKIGYFTITGDLKWAGPLNNKRPLTMTDNGFIYCLPLGNQNQDKFDIGEIVSDVTIPTTNGNLYLSLKYGGTVTFVNAGVKKAFPEQAFINKNPNLFTPIGTALLDLFKVNPIKFINIFNGYSDDKTGVIGAKDKDTEDVTELINKDKLREFVKSAIGYGYVLIHSEANGKLHIYDLRTFDGLKKLLGGEAGTEEDMDPQSVIVLYPKEQNGKYYGKRIDIAVEYKNLSLKFNIRPKDGSVYPTHIMSDYKIKGV